jgi:hypothetical protein
MPKPQFGEEPVQNGKARAHANAAAPFSQTASGAFAPMGSLSASWHAATYHRASLTESVKIFNARLDRLRTGLLSKLKRRRMSLA